MAITKILYIGENDNSKGSHLQKAIDYIQKPEKTENGKYVEAINCTVDSAYKEMIRTKKFYGKTDKRQGYHIMISLKPGEGSPDTIMKITRAFAKEYLGKDYEAIYSVHTDKEHLHGHIIFNSVKFTDGYKYRYELGDWQSKIQPLVDKYCLENGVSKLDYHEDEINKQTVYSKSFNWKNEIKKDIDAAILKANSWNEFLPEMKSLGYAYKLGKYISVKKKGMERYRRLTDKLGIGYDPESIRERIESKSSPLHFTPISFVPRIQKVKKFYYKKRKFKDLTPYEQERIRTILKNQPCKVKRKAWMTSEEYKKWKQRQNDIDKRFELNKAISAFITRFNISCIEDVEKVLENIIKKEKQLYNQKKDIQRRLSIKAPILNIFYELKKLEDAKEKFLKTNNSTYAADYHRYRELEESLLKTNNSIITVENYLNAIKVEEQSIKNSIYNLKKINSVALSLREDMLNKEKVL